MEYKVEFLRSDNLEAQTQENLLTELAKEGWELVTVVANIGGDIYGEGQVFNVSGTIGVEGLWFYFRK